MQATDLFLGLISGGNAVKSREPFPQRVDENSQTGKFQSVLDHATRKQSSRAEAGSAREAQKTSESGADKAERPEQSNSTAKNAEEITQQQADVNRKLEALVERLRQELEEGEGAADEQTLELLIKLLALMAAAAQQQPEQAESALALELSLDGEGKLGEILDLLLAGREAIAAEDLEGVNLLVKLGEDKGIMIPLSELMKADAESEEPEGSMKLELKLTDASDASKTVELKLTLSAESMRNAQLVDMTDPALKDSEIALTIPLDVSAAEQAKSALDEELSSILAKLPELKAGKQEAEVRMNEEKVVAETDRMTAADSEKAKAAFTLKPAQGSSESGVKIFTAEPLYPPSDVSLKSLDAEALAKELASVGSDRVQIYERLQKLLFGDQQSQLDLEKMLAGKLESATILKSLLEEFSEGAGRNPREWAESLLRESSGKASANAADDASRIPFLGRERVQNPIQEILISKAETAAATHSGQRLQENVMSQIMGRMSYTALNGANGEIRIALRPAELGDLYLKVKVEQDVVTAKFTAQSNEVKAIIENNLGQLKQALEEMGVKVGKFEVEVSAGNQGQPQNARDDAPGGSYQADYGTAAMEMTDSYAATLDFDSETTGTYGLTGRAVAGQASISYLA
jgi:flagellar hook-length control protein FliK